MKLYLSNKLWFFLLPAMHLPIAISEVQSSIHFEMYCLLYLISIHCFFNNLKHYSFQEYYVEKEPNKINYQLKIRIASFASPFANSYGWISKIRDTGIVQNVPNYNPTRQNLQNVHDGKVRGHFQNVIFLLRVWFQFLKVCSIFCYYYQLNVELLQLSWIHTWGGH
jgi:hypothetical protein